MVTGFDGSAAKRWLAASALLLAGATAPLSPQLGSFGQNKIHFRGFEWQVLRGEHVDLYFYPEEEELARVALAYAEESFNVLTAKLEHVPRRRIPLILYASHADFEQTNILPFVPPEGILGVTEFLKRRVTLPFNGNYAEFRHTLRHELVHAFQLSLEAEVAERYPRTRRPMLPLWFTEGMAEFWSAKQDSRDEMILRDLVVSGRLPGLPELTWVSGGVAYPIGGIIHEWLAATYGEWRVAALFHDLWKYADFAEAMAGTYGRSLGQLSEEWLHWMRRRYYPVVAEREPLDLRARRLSQLAVKPAVFASDSSAAQVFYLSPRSGYTNIYAEPLAGGRAQVVVEGERSTEFESFHTFYSRLDVSSDGVIAFGSKYLERDALFLWNLAEEKVVGRYQFPELISILSPSWAPDGRTIVFSGLSVSGYSDLYRLTLATGELERLTSDRFEDVDPSVGPDGRTVVFSSDRTPFGRDGALNLFLLDLETRQISYVTYGAWRDEGPRWSHGDGRIYFSSDRAGTFEIYSATPDGRGRREVRTLNGAFDPWWVPERAEVVFGGFADLSFQIFAARPEHAAGEPFEFTLDEWREPPGWAWAELGDPRYARADAAPYEKKFTLDFAAGEALAVPGVGSSQGAALLFSDLLSDHLLFVGISAVQGDGLGGIVDNLNASVAYINQSRRLNWGLGAYRVRGVFYEGDFESVYEESAVGGYGLLRFPFSRFRRMEVRYGLEHSDRVDVSGEFAGEQRRAWLALNSFSYVKDNTLWLTTGPIDGERFNISIGAVSDISNGRFDSFLGGIDYRRYFRIKLRTTYAIRGFAYYGGGQRPRRVNIGGSWGLRGYPRFGVVAGSRALLLSQELRFPLMEFVSLGLPIGELRFPGVQGALFVDVARAWTDETTEVRGVLGSYGFGFRMPLLSPLILRLDFGWRFSALGGTLGYSIDNNFPNKQYVDFFFGFNY